MVIKSVPEYMMQGEIMEKLRKKNSKKRNRTVNTEKISENKIPMTTVVVHLEKIYQLQTSIGHC